MFMETPAPGGHQADIAKVQEWLGHASIVTTRIYDRRTTRPLISRLVVRTRYTIDSAGPK